MLSPTCSQGRTNIVSCFGLVFAFCFAFPAFAQQTPRLITSSEFEAARAKLSPTLVPLLRSPLQPDPRQSFLIPGTGGRSLRMIPVRYDAYTPAADNTTFRCGLFLFPAGRAPIFVPTMGYGSTEMEFCASLNAVGFTPAPGHTFPRLLLLYSGGTAHDQTVEPIILDFSDAKGTYIANDDLSERIANIPGKPTIAWMKSTIARMDAHR